MKINPTRLAIVLEYLQSGGKLKSRGLTYVWLNEHVVRETEDQKWVIDGLAIEIERTNPEEYENKDPFEYLGRRDMPIEQLFGMVQDIHLEEYRRICIELKAMREKATV